MTAAKAGFDYAAASLTKKDPLFVEAMNENQGKIIIDGNAAAALGAMFAGVTVVTWYPITPSSSVCEQLIDYMKKYRIGPDGEATFAIVQAEDELAAIGMVLGASWAGARAMTATSGPGISLMTEFTGMGYYAEIPAVIFDIQRVGPSTGLPTRTSQGDVLSIAFLGHGDTKNNMERLNRKFETSRSYLPRPEIVANVGAKIGVIAYGSSDFAVRESRDQLKNEYRLAIDYVRIRAFPFSREVHDFIDKHERVYV